MSDAILYQTDAMDTLRLKIDREVRFKRVLRGYEPKGVHEYVAELRNAIKTQRESAKAAEADLRAEIDALSAQMERQRQQLLASDAEAARQNSAISLRDAQIEALRREQAQAARSASEKAAEYEHMAAELKKAHGSVDELTALRQERGELSAQISIRNSSLEQCQSAISRLTEENKQLNVRLKKAEEKNSALKLDLAEYLSLSSALEEHTDAMLEGKLEDIRGLLSACRRQCQTQAEAIKTRMSE